LQSRKKIRWLKYRRSKHRNTTFRNLLGAIIPAIQSNDPKKESFLSLPIYIPLQIKNGALLRTIPIAQQQRLACGLDVNKVVLPAVGRATNSRTVLVFELFFPLFND
jgi:hypothetical protein